MAGEIDIELEVLKVSPPVSDFGTTVRRFQKRRAQRKLAGEPVEVITIPDESKKRKREGQADDVPTNDSLLGWTFKKVQYVTIPMEKKSEQGLEGDNKKDDESNRGRGTDDGKSFSSDSTNDSGISTGTSGTTDDSGVMSDSMDVSIISSGAIDALPLSANESAVTSSITEDNGCVFDSSASPISTAGQDVNLNCSDDDDIAVLLVPPPPLSSSPVTPEDSIDGMPKLCLQLANWDFGDDEADDMPMPTLIPELTDQSGNCGETEAIGGSQVQVTWMEGEDDVERATQVGKNKKFSTVKRRFGLPKGKGRRAFLSLEETSSLIGKLSWCKICDSYYSTLDELRSHIVKVHQMDGSLVNRYNQATWDLEIARTYENPLDLEKDQEI